MWFSINLNKFFDTNLEPGNELQITDAIVLNMEYANFYA